MLFAFKPIISDMLMSASDLHVVHNHPLRSMTVFVTHCTRASSTALIRPTRACRPEHELCESHGVGRITIRQALERLRQEGWVEKIRGQGTFVQRSRAVQNISALHRLRPATIRSRYAKSAVCISSCMQPKRCSIAPHA